MLSRGDVYLAIFVSYSGVLFFMYGILSAYLWALFLRPAQSAEVDGSVWVRPTLVGAL